MLERTHKSYVYCLNRLTHSSVTVRWTNWQIERHTEKQTDGQLAKSDPDVCLLMQVIQKCHQSLSHQKNLTLQLNSWGSNCGILKFSEGHNLFPTSNGTAEPILLFRNLHTDIFSKAQWNMYILADVFAAPWQRDKTPHMDVSKLHPPHM